MLSLGLVTVAGADALQSQGTSVNKGLQQVLEHFNCAGADAKLSRVATLNAQFSKHEAALTADLTAQQGSHHAARVKFYDNRLAAVRREQALVDKEFKRPEARVAKLAQKKCHLTLPAGT